jgi:tetratricopeptide (TPR) repeat protein
VETLYSLLVAEVAGSRGRYDIALGNYVQEAHRTRDPGVAARAARIARYLNAHQAALSSALLWVEIEPDNAEALFIASSELAETGRLLEAFEYSEKLLEYGSASIFQSIAARAAQATDTERESLINNFERLLAIHPRDMQLLVGKAMLLQQQNKLPEALTTVQQALAIEDDNVPAAILEARLLFAMDQAESALDRLLTLLQQNPDNQRLRLQYARLLTSIDLAQALEQFKLLVERSPNNPELLLSLGLVANEQGEKEVAAQAFARLLATGQHQDSAHYYLGRLAEEQEDFNRALEHFLKVEQGQDFLSALANAVDIMIRLGRLDDARARMIELRSRFAQESVRLYQIEAQALARYQYLTEAESLVTEALTFNPDSTELLFTRATINEQRDMIDLAENDFRTIIRYQPNNATALNALGYTLADRTNRYHEALELIEKALNIEPNNAAIIDSMGWVQYRLGNYQEAILRLREALKALPDPEIAAHLGEVLWSAGEKEEARQVWTDGMSLDPSSDLIPDTLKRLNVEL